MHQRAEHHMKLRTVFPFTLVLSALVFTPLWSQTRATDEEPDELGERIDLQIERFLDKVSKSLSSRSFDDLFDPDTIERKPRRPVRTADLETEGYAHSFNGNSTVEEGETITGNVVVKGGDLRVRGTVDGDVLIVGGTLYVDDGGTVTGNARVINGDIVKAEG